MVEVSPPKGVLEAFRYFRPADEPWFALQGALLWRCVGSCIETAKIGAHLVPASCASCTRKLRGPPITIDLIGIKQIVLQARA